MKYLSFFLDIVIQHHVKRYGRAFARDWDDYKDEFGSPDGNFYWIGLQRMHELTSSGAYQLEINLRTGNESKTLQWSAFSVGSESKNYRLSASGFDQGTSGLSDRLSPHNGAYFSTQDRDNDGYSSGSCSSRFGNTGWWYKRCFACHLTHVAGPYYDQYYSESTMVLKRK